VWGLNLCNEAIGLGAGFGAFVSGLEIPLPGNGRGAGRETGSWWQPRAISLLPSEANIHQRDRYTLGRINFSSKQYASLTEINGSRRTRS